MSISFLIHLPCAHVPRNLIEWHDDKLLLFIDPGEDIIKITGCIPSVDDQESWVLFTCILISETSEVASFD